MKDKSPYNFKFIYDPEEALAFLSYDMPEIVIIDLSNKNGILDVIYRHIQKDPWLNSFAIIGLFDGGSDIEEELLERVPDMNLVNLVEYGHITSSLLKSIRIVEENRQIIFQRDLASHLLENMTGTFEIENSPYAVGCYASLLAIHLFNNGYVDRKGKNALYISLVELIMNGIEHGNCGITFQEKSDFLGAGRDIGDLIEQKCAHPAVAPKRVRVHYAITPERSVYRIQDEGAGFDWANVRNPVDGSGIFRLHGRGILMARHFASNLTYNEMGNEAVFTLEHSGRQRRGIPVGFVNEEKLSFASGQVVFKENEESDHLFFIASGRYGVFRNDHRVGTLTPADIFMGEMSFLMNHRRSARVTTEQEGLLVKISKQAFVSVIKRYPHYGIYLSKILAQKLARTNETVSGSAGSPAERSL